MFTAFKSALAVAIVTSVLWVPQLAHAAPAVDQTQSLATGGSGGPVCSNMGPMSINDAAGTTFTAGITGLLTSIDIPLLWISTSDNLQVSLYATSSGLPTGQALATQVITASNLTAVASGGTLTAVFSSPATVQSGSGYALALSFPTCSSSAQASIATVTSIPGRAFIYKQGASAWSNYGPTGINFTTYVDATSVQNTPIPSPTPSMVASPPAASTVGQLALTGANSTETILSGATFAAVLAGAGVWLLTRKTRRRSSGLHE